MSEELLFESVKEPHNEYFAEYSPPIANNRFAVLTLVFHQGTTPDLARAAMEKEGRLWLERYPIALMVFASDEKGDSVQLSDTLEGNQLMSWRRPDGAIEMRWELVKDEELPDDALDVERLLDVYRDIKYRTEDEVRTAADAKWRKLRIGSAIIITWAVVVPITIAVLGFASVVIGVLALLYALYRAIRQGALMLGWLRPTEREKAEREKEQKMHHYYYHCERNPDGFRRILIENFEHDERERIKNEAEEIATLELPGKRL